MAGDNIGAETASTLHQPRSRDEIDNEAIRQAWLTFAGAVPDTAAGRVSRGEVFYSALDLAEHLIAPNELSGWRISFTSEGGPYTATLMLHNPRSGIVSEISAEHAQSLTLAFIAVIGRWAGTATK
ncbi:MAG: hypothetical protein WDN50_06215 [Bradyrhizobium sp.]